MAGFGTWLKAVGSQLNPLDGGANYNSVMEEERRRKEQQAQMAKQLQEQRAKQMPRGVLTPQGQQQWMAGSPLKATNPVTNPAPAPNTINATTRLNQNNILQRQQAPMQQFNTTKQIIDEAEERKQALMAESQRLDNERREKLQKAATANRNGRSDQEIAKAVEAAVQSGREAREAQKQAQITQMRKESIGSITAPFRAIPSALKGGVDQVGRFVGNSGDNINIAVASGMQRLTGDEKYGRMRDSFQKGMEDRNKFYDSNQITGAFTKNDADVGFAHDLGGAGTRLGLDLAIGSVTGNVLPAAMQFTEASNASTKDAMDHGKSFEDAHNIGLTSGAVQAGLEKVGLDKLTRPFGGKATSRAISGALTEGATEGAQQFAQNLIKKWSYDPEQDLMEGVGENALMGGLLGGPAGAVNIGGQQGNIDGNGGVNDTKTVIETALNSPQAQVDLETVKNIAQNSESLTERVAANRVLSERFMLAGQNATGYADAQTQGLVFDGVDGKPRFEVDDSGAKILNANGNTLGDVLDHPQLFEQYDGLQNVKVLKDAGRGEDAYVSEGVLHIKPDTTQGTLLHEIQHLIQDKEGFSGGGSPSDFKTKSIPSKLKNVDFKRFNTKNQIRNKLKELGVEVPHNVKNGDWSIASIENPRVRELAQKHTPELLAQYDELNSQIGKYQTSTAQYARLAGEAEARAVEARMDMPMSERYRQPKTADEYAMSHRPDPEGATLDDISQKGEFVPEDIYDNPQWYGDVNDAATRESVDIIRKVRNNPEAEVTVYRAAPKNELNHGDWISLSKKYAQGESAVEGTKVHSFKVKAKELRWPGDSFNEFGYFPEQKPRSTFYDSLDVPKEDLIIRNDQKLRTLDQPSQNKTTEKAVLDRNQKMFGDKNVSFHDLGTYNGVRIDGYYADDMISLSKGNVNMDTFNHESVHKAFDQFIGESQRQQILDQIIKDHGGAKLVQKYRKMGYGNINVKVAAEEELANGFIKYVNAKAEGKKIAGINVPPKFLAYFDRVWQGIKSFVGKADNVQQLYAQLESGKFKNAQVKPRTMPAQLADNIANDPEMAQLDETLELRKQRIEQLKAQGRTENYHQIAQLNKSIDDIISQQRQLARQLQGSMMLDPEMADHYIRETVAQHSSPDEYRQSLIDGIWSRNKEGKGVDTGLIENNPGEGSGYSRRWAVSNNSPFYQEFYAEYGHKPTKKAIAEMVDAELRGEETMLSRGSEVSPYEADIYAQIKEEYDGRQQLTDLYNQAHAKAKTPVAQPKPEAQGTTTKVYRSEHKDRYGIGQTQLGSGMYVGDRYLATRLKDGTTSADNLFEYRLNPEAKFIGSRSDEFMSIKRQARQDNNLKGLSGNDWDKQYSDNITRIVIERGYDGVRDGNIETVAMSQKALIPITPNAPIYKSQTPKPQAPKATDLNTPDVKPADREYTLSEEDYKEFGITDADLTKAEQLANDYISQIDKAGTKSEVLRIANRGYAELGEIPGGTLYQKSVADAEVYRRQHLVDTGVEPSGIDHTRPHEAPKITAQEQAARGQAEFERRAKLAGLTLDENGNIAPQAPQAPKAEAPDPNDARAKIASLENSMDELDKQINSLLRKSRKASTAAERLNLESKAQELRKQKRKLSRDKFEIQDALYSDTAQPLLTPDEYRKNMESFGSDKAKIDKDVEAYANIYNQAHAEAQAQPAPQTNSQSPTDRTGNKKVISSSSAVDASVTAPRTPDQQPSQKKGRPVSEAQPQSGQTPTTPEKSVAVAQKPKSEKTGKLSTESRQLPQTQQQAEIQKTSETRLGRPYPDNTTETVKKRGFVKSVKGSDEVSTDVKRKVDGKYNVRSTEALELSASEFAKGSLNKITKDVNDRLAVKDGTASDQDIADGIAVAKRLDANKKFDEAEAIYEKLANHGTKGGQAIQAFSLLQKRTPDGLKFHMLRKMKKAGIEISKKDQAEFGRLIDNVRKTKVNSESRDRALFETLDFVSRRMPTSTGDKIVNFWRAGLLTAPKTTGGNILGNTTEAVGRDLWVNPVAVATDKFFSLFTGRRTKVISGGRLAGAKEGLAKGVDYMKTGYDTRNINGKFDAPRRVNYKNKIIDTYVNGVYRWMGAQDQPFYYSAKSAAAHDLAKADGINLGLKGEQLAKYVEESVLDGNWKPQTFKTKKSVEDYAKYAVYQNETVLGSMATGLKTAAGKKNIRWLADFILPFTQVPSSVAMRVIDRTPVGIAREVVSQVRKKQFDQRAMAEAIGNGSFALPVVAAGMALAKAGELTGDYPDDEDERKLWQLEGKQPYSVRVGDRWYSLNYMQPFGTLLNVGKQVHDDREAGKSDAEAWLNATASTAQSVSDQSFLQGLNGILSAVNNPERSAKQFIKSTAGSTVPNFIRSFASATDDKQRDTPGVVLDPIKGAIPGLRQTLPERQDMFGKPLDSKDNPANMYLNPFNPSKVKETSELVDELRRLKDGDNGITTTKFSKNSIAGAELDDKQVRNLNELVNSEAGERWSKLISQDEYKSMSDEDKVTALKKVKDAVANNVKAQFVKDNNIQSTTDYKTKDIDSMPITGSGSTGVKISKNLDKTHKTVLEQYNNMNTDQRREWFEKENDAEYKYELAKYNNNLAENKLSTAGRIKAQKYLRKSAIGKDYSKNVRDLYSLSKADLSDYLTTEEEGVDKQKLYDQLVEYDRKLKEAGVTASLKFKTGLASGKGGRSGGKGGSRGGSGGSRGTGITAMQDFISTVSGVNKSLAGNVTKMSGKGFSESGSSVKPAQLKTTTLASGAKKKSYNQKDLVKSRRIG